MCNNIDRAIDKKVRKETELEFYKVMALAAVLYGKESWTVGKDIIFKKIKRLRSERLKQNVTERT